MFQKALLHSLLRQSGGPPFSVTYPDGETRTYGQKGDADEGPRFRLILNRPLDLGAVRSSPMVELGEAYMDGIIDIEGDLRDVFRMGIRLMEESDLLGGDRGEAADRFMQRQREADEKEQTAGVQHHYDLGNDFFRLWLDETMSYSCAYFRRPDDSLRQAQLQKIDHSLRKLQLREGDRLLDIGSGWGHLIIRAARQYGARAVGITLSEEQVKETRKRIEAEGLGEQVEVRLADYRELPQSEQFDKIVSIGMFEHVGKEHIPGYFATVRRMLSHGGLSLLHTLTHPREDPSNPWLEKHIFPWGYIPSGREVVWQLPEHHFHLLDAESLRLHYAMTTDRWADNFEDVVDRVRQQYGERFVRMWRLFLTGCTVSFRHTGLDVHQFLFSHGLNNELPLTREYLYP